MVSACSGVCLADARLSVSTAPEFPVQEFLTVVSSHPQMVCYSSAFTARPVQSGYGRFKESYIIDSGLMPRQ